ALRPGGVFRFATDIPDYAAWTLERLTRAPDFIWTAERVDDWRQPWAGFRGTRYEAKAKREGRMPCYLGFRRKGEFQSASASPRLTRAAAGGGDTAGLAALVAGSAGAICGGFAASARTGSTKPEPASSRLLAFRVLAVVASRYRSVSGSSFGLISISNAATP